MKVKRRQLPAPWIPFITLADIAWQVLILMFVVVGATWMSNWSLTVPLPSATVSPSKTIGKTIRVEAGETYLRVNGMKVHPADLELQLSGLLAGAKSEEERAVVLVAADDLSFQRNADILYAIQQAGGVILISEERTGEAGAKKN